MKKTIQAVNPWYTPVIARNAQWNSSKQPWINAPFAFNGWACATDGHVILAVDAEVVPEVVVPEGLRRQRPSLQDQPSPVLRHE